MTAPQPPFNPGPFAPGKGIAPGSAVEVTTLAVRGTDVPALVGTLIEVAEEPWPHVLVWSAGRTVFVGLGPGVVVEPSPAQPG